jgi:hypothetical protein
MEETELACFSVAVKVRPDTGLRDDGHRGSPLLSRRRSKGNGAARWGAF